MKREHPYGQAVQIENHSARILFREGVEPMRSRHHVDAITDRPASDLSGHHAEMPGDEDTAGALGGLVKTMVGPVSKPQIDILGDERRTLHHCGTGPDYQVRDPELVQSREKGPLTGFEYGVGHGEVISGASLTAYRAR